MAWENTLKKGQEIILATSSKGGKPNAIVVISLGFVDGKLLIGACLMVTSLKNILKNYHNMAWKNTLKKGQEMILATSSKNGKPNAIVVISLGFVDGKLLIGACLMVTSLKNILETKRVCIVAKNKGEYYRIKGMAKVFPSGKYLDIAIKRSSPPLPKQAILITIEEVFDLDKGKKIL